MECSNADCDIFGCTQDLELSLRIHATELLYLVVTALPLTAVMCSGTLLCDRG